MRPILECVPIDQLKPGMSARLGRTLGRDDIALFAAVCGDLNPVHLDRDFAEASPFGGVIAHGVWGAGLISAVIGMHLPGPGTIYLGQTLKFTAPVRPGQRVEAIVTVMEVDPERRRVTLESRLEADGVLAILGEARVLAPAEAVRVEIGPEPLAMLGEQGSRLVALIEAAAGRPPFAVRPEPGAAAGLQHAEAYGLVRIDPAAAVSACGVRPDDPFAAGVILVDAPAAEALFACAWGPATLWAPIVQAAGLNPHHPARAESSALRKAGRPGGPAILHFGDAGAARLVADTLDHLGGATCAEILCDALGRPSAVVGDDPEGVELAAALAVLILAHPSALA